MGIDGTAIQRSRCRSVRTQRLDPFVGSRAWLSMWCQRAAEQLAQALAQQFRVQPGRRQEAGATTRQQLQALPLKSSVRQQMVDDHRIKRV